MKFELAGNEQVASNFLRDVECLITFDAPEKLIDNDIQEFVGWFAAKLPSYPEIFINGNLILNIFYYDRPDVSEYTKGSFSRAWKFYVDVARYMSASQGALLLEVFWNGQLVERKLYRVSTDILPANDRELVAFLHVPKSGGTSLRLALEEQAASYRMLASYEDYGFFQIKDLYLISERTLSRYEGIYGHFQYGVHKNFGRRVRYISMIRNPYRLLLSYYFYARSSLKNPEVLACRDVFEAVSTKANQYFDNIITRMFSGVSAEEPVNIETYRAAVANIDHHFEFIGTLEDVEASFQRIGAYLGLELNIKEENVHDYSAEIKFMDMAKFRSFCQPYIRFDLAIYEYVLRKFWGAGDYLGSENITNEDFLSFGEERAVI